MTKLKKAQIVIFLIEKGIRVLVPGYYLFETVFPIKIIFFWIFFGKRKRKLVRNIKFFFLCFKEINFEIEL